MKNAFGIGTAIAQTIASLGETADRFIPTEEDRNRFKLEASQQLMQAQRQEDEARMAELEATTRIIEAELDQDDHYSKRARPTIVYAGLLFIFLVYVVMPYAVAYWDVAEPPQVELPAEFWWSWGTVVSVYGLGKSAERLGKAGKATEWITGNRKAPKARKLREQLIGPISPNQNTTSSSVG